MFWLSHKTPLKVVPELPAATIKHWSEKRVMAQRGLLMAIRSTSQRVPMREGHFFPLQQRRMGDIVRLSVLGLDPAVTRTNSWFLSRAQVSKRLNP